MKVYTIGYGVRKDPRKDFAQLMANHGVEVVCDISAAPQRACQVMYKYNTEPFFYL